MPNIMFIVGTDTDVGKTYVSSLVAKTLHHSGVKVGVYKPVASGCRMVAGQRVSDDADLLWNAAGKPGKKEWVCPQKFIAALAPNVAAAAEASSVDADLLTQGMQPWMNQCDTLIVEGAGGLMSPLADDILNIDFFLKLPPAKLFVVAANRLGVIHQTLATCAAAEIRGVSPAGIILCSVAERSDDSVAENATQLAKYTTVPVLGQVGFGCRELPFDVSRLLEI
jgi:dethiobiotin synthetase